MSSPIQRHVIGETIKFTTDAGRELTGEVIALSTGSYTVRTSEGHVVLRLDYMYYPPRDPGPNELNTNTY